jgi:putative ABC transport system ATP-binding protein
MSEQTPAIRIRGLVKTFDEGLIRALNGVDMHVMPGEFVAVVGPSGCGKSTLLHLIAALDRPDEGTIEVLGHELRTEHNLNHYRARDVGMVFQLDNLIMTLNAAENVQVPMFESPLSVGARTKRASELLELVGLVGREKNRPSQLSGGERQRVAIARALANDPPILLADEPTGRLDSVSGRRILELIDDLRSKRGLTVVLVTHEANVASRADRIIRMLDGRIVEAETEAGLEAEAAAGQEK